MSLGCGARNEASAVVGAIDRYRAAPNDQKPAFAEALSRAQCADREVCGVKESCLRVSQPTARGLLLQEEVARGLKDVESGTVPKSSPAARALAQKLEEAVVLLRDGDVALSDCDRKVAGLRSKYRL